MIITLHGISVMHSNIITQIRVAEECGFGGIELVEAHLLRYLATGRDITDIARLLQKKGIKAVCINALKNVEVQAPADKKELLINCRILCKAAKAMQCPTIQLVPFCALEGRPASEILQLTAMNIKEIADIGAEYGLRFQLEPIAYSPINSLKLSLELISMCDRKNIGMVIDFWHLAAGNGTGPDEVAALDKNMIYGVHFCDGMKNPPGAPWNEADLRSYLPGEGELDVAGWVEAVKKTGYDGSWSSELYSPYHWEMDIDEIAQKLKGLMEKYIL